MVDGVTTIKRTLAGVYLQTIVGGSTSDQYLFHDQLGNLARITDAAGTPINSLDYAAFGGRRDWSTQGSGGQVPTLTTRGFTGQEHIDGNLGLMHFNARMYDPAQGRFLQPDPVIQAPDNAQSWNAYSYCFNNPYRYTDPTGMIGTTERQWLGTIVAIVATVFAPQGAGLWYSMLVGAVAGGISTGTWQGALYGAFSAALFYGIGSYFQGQAWANGFENMMGGDVQTIGSTGLTAGQLTGKVIAHGIAGGIMSRLQGGKFGNGFVSAGFTEALAPGIGKIGNRVGQGVVATIVGGTASVLSGGKFANGAETAAFSYAFNQVFHSGGSKPNEIGRTGVARAMEIYRSEGYEIIGTEVLAELPGFTYGRRYDFVVRSSDGAYIGVEVKSSERGIFRMDKAQAAFDMAVLSSPNGAQVAYAPYRITGISYVGVNLSDFINARWQQSMLYRLLEMQNQRPRVTN